MSDEVDRAKRVGEPDLTPDEFEKLKSYEQADHLGKQARWGLDHYHKAGLEALYGVISIANPDQQLAFLQGLCQGEIDRRHDKSEWRRTWWTIGGTLLGFLGGGFISAWAQNCLIFCPQ